MTRRRTALVAGYALGVALAPWAPGCQAEPPRAPAAAEAGRPAIACAAPVHRFGRVWQGAEVVHTFRVENRGPGPLHLARLRAACACTSATLSAAELAPGEEAAVDVTLDTRGLLGPIERAVEVVSDDPDQPNLPLRLAGEVALAAAFAEERLDLGTLRPRERKRAAIGLRGVLAEQARLSDLTLSGAEGWSARVVEVEGATQVEVELDAGQSPGPRDARLGARTGLAEAPEIRLSLVAEVALDLQADRPAVSFDPFRADAPPKETISVRSARGAAFAVTGGADPAGVVAVHVGPRPPRAGMPQEIELELTRAPEVPRGSLRIRTDRADQPVLELPYVVRAYARPEPPATFERRGRPGRSAP